MTIRTSGPLTMAEIKAELASASNRLGDYFAAAGMGPPYAMSRFYGYSSGFKFSLAISTSTSQFDLRAWLLENTAWNGIQQVGGTLVINPGVYLSDAGAGYTLRIADLPPASVIDLIFYGISGGRGGAGGRGGDFNAQNATPGGQGGRGLLIRNTVRLRDMPGSIIAGGGGGGGGGGGAGTTWDGSIYAVGGGGGGGGQSGYPIVIGGGGGGLGSISVLNNGQPGGAGTHTGPGAGGAGGYGTLPGVGGAGGAWGQPGQRGSDAHPVVPLTMPGVGAPGGPAGLAVDGWAHVQHIEHAGTFYGGLG